MSEHSAILTPSSADAGARLHSDYVWAVNQAIAAGGTVLVSELADAYVREASDLDICIPQARNEMAYRGSRRGGRRWMRRASVNGYLDRAVNPPAKLAPAHTAVDRSGTSARSRTIHAASRTGSVTTSDESGRLSARSLE